MNKKEKNKMINTYDSYVKEPRAITIEQMRKMHENMMLEIGEDEDAGKRSTVERAIRRRESR